jgi:DNA primase
MDAAEVKARVSLFDLVSRKTTLERVSDIHGGEYSGPCPFCGGEDRFSLQLNARLPKKPEGERWMCRKCSPRWGDNIGFVQKDEKLDFQQALEWLGQYAGIPSTAPTAAPLPTAKIEPDRATWVNAALDFLEECNRQLFSEAGEKALEYLHGRGLSDEILQEWQIGFNPREGHGNPEMWGFSADDSLYIPRGIVIPCHDAAGFHYLKIRQSQGEPRYRVLRGGQMWPFGLRTYKDQYTAFLFESELDALLAYQTGFNLGYASLPAGQLIRAEYQPFFSTILDVLVAYDNDQAGQVNAAKLCRIPGFHQAQPFPAGKDLTEYYRAAGCSLEAVFEWLYGQVETLK